MLLLLIMNEITVRYLWTADDLLKGTRFHFRQLYSRAIHYLFWVVVVGMITAGLNHVSMTGRLQDGLFVLSIGLFPIFYIKLLYPWIIRRQFAKRPDVKTKIEWRITSDNLQVRNTQGSSEFIWSALCKVIETPEGFLFYPTEQIFHWLPRHGFASDADFDSLVQLAQQNAKVFRRIK
jgi:YcxB-like protein